MNAERWAARADQIASEIETAERFQAFPNEWWHDVFGETAIPRERPIQPVNSRPQFWTRLEWTRLEVKRAHTERQAKPRGWAAKQLARDEFDRLIASLSTAEWAYVFHQAARRGN